ncbi:MAG: NAD+ synthase [Methanobacterium sp.]|nr:NAD+ synthase [Methanobacterium sp.]
MQEETNNILGRDQEKIANKITKFITDKKDETQSSGIVIGLSGGLDSSTTAYLCAKAVKSNQILGIIMPTTTTSNEDIEDAITVAKTLKIEYEIIDVDNLIEPFNDLCTHSKRTEETLHKLANANLKARIRMMILYYHANKLNRLVVGTGNRTELLIGYFTKYGDGGVDILPIGDLYKTEVKLLATHIEVPTKIIEKPPTAGLWPGQTDEKELGIKYELLDKILYLMVDKNMEDTNIAQKLNITIEEVLRIKDKVNNAVHKLKTAPSPDIFNQPKL